MTCHRLMGATAVPGNLWGRWVSSQMKLFGLATCLAALTACEMPRQFSEGLPPMLVQNLPDGSEKVMTGRILPKMDYSSTFTMQDANGLTCAGAFSSRGVGQMTCSDGLAMALSVPREHYGRTSGAFVQQDGGIGVALGRGDQAGAATLRAMF